jgi:hypothetical protein
MRGMIGVAKIHLLTGTAFTQTIEVECNEGADLIQVIDGYYEEHGELPVAMYKTEDLTEEEMETYIPINGGQFWIEGISHVDF